MTRKINKCRKTHMVIHPNRIEMHTCIREKRHDGTCTDGNVSWAPKEAQDAE